MEIFAHLQIEVLLFKHKPKHSGGKVMRCLKAFDYSAELFKGIVSNVKFAWGLPDTVRTPKWSSKEPFLLFGPHSLPI